MPKILSYNITVNGHRTSVRLETAVRDALEHICFREHTTPHVICSELSLCKEVGTSLSSAIRVFALSYFRTAATEQGHLQAGHGAKRKPEAIARLVKDALHTKTHPYPPPTPLLIQNALNAVLTMLDEESACRLENALATFGQLPRDKLN